MYAETQPPKDWQLLLVVLLIAAIEVSFSIPILTLALLNGDIAVTNSLDRKPAFNVSMLITLQFHVMLISHAARKKVIVFAVGTRSFGEVLRNQLRSINIPSHLHIF